MYSPSQKSLSQQSESPKQQSTTYIQSINQSQQSVVIQLDPQRKKYGNMIVIMQRPFLITLGPDCGFSFFCILAYCLCLTVKSVFTNQYVIYSTYAISISQVTSYLLVALSNPNISLKQQNPISLQKLTKSNQHLTCKKCGGQQRKKTYHCYQCDVCIRGYDHHCPWTSKCIGSGNLYRFYAFVTITPIYILYFIGLMFASLILSTQTANSHIKTNLTKAL